MSNAENLRRLAETVRQLGPLAEQMVFVGGSTTALFMTDAAAADVRETVDIDAIVETTRLGYARLTEALNQQGFTEDTSEGAPICRFRSGDLVLDVMPTDEQVLGFSNPWYLPAIRHAEWVSLPGEGRIRVITAPYFLATKLVAFAGRGQGDYGMSHDISDIVAVLDGRPELVADIAGSDLAVKSFLAQSAQDLLTQPAFLETLSYHLLPDAASQARETLILRRLSEIAGLMDDEA
ncbi:nucleotidyl transferase AbiEii/AbiGii toxin family protein [Deinococcus sp. SDU3-2]|uniref:Nucleotidyl transferase AbiEii/AbiGii toxin family protein n=1 Tax=Deinococcus terrestris TaxID=2651870 RepID=A0A7X1NYX5_9DEIO|nr:MULTISPECIES: nucleotidyl transferase AbiEii/AbiGii toxin family protein [Deinococcus]MPY68362.1 nucleotidyl transferase AbiEii/AbiGii toxin family protein [Deinococcus terrestris]